MRMKLEIIYEDNHLIAVNKPAGVLVQGDKTGDQTLADQVKWYIKNRYQKPGDVYLGIIHRIDRPVSGTVLFARTSKALTRMNEMFAKRQVEKVYWAITTDRPPEEQASLTHFLKKDHERNQTRVYKRLSNRIKDAKKSTLHYQLEAHIGGHTLLVVKPETGRSHQIRAQLGAIGCPIKGDRKYGQRLGNEDGSICLHSHSLSFIHPVKKEPVLIQSYPEMTQQWDIFRSRVRG